MNTELSGAEQITKERLEKLGATFSKMRFTGDNAFPTEYRIVYKNHLIVHPTLELALISLIEYLVN